MFEAADLHQDGVLVRRGRPPGGHLKDRVTLRLDHGVVDALWASGRGWQTRVNQMLRDWLRRGAA